MHCPCPRLLLLPLLSLAAACHHSPPNDEQPAVTRLGHWHGSLPCTDCTAIEIDLQLFAVPGDDHGPFQLREQQRGTRDGDRGFDVTGIWTTRRGLGGDAAAVIYRLDAGDPETVREFVRISDTRIELLDGTGHRIESKLDYGLERIAD